MKKIYLIALAIIIAGLLPISAFATSDNSMPDLEKKNLDLSVYFFVEEDRSELSISGAKIAICRIADVSCENGVVNYTLLSQYQSLKKTDGDRDITFENMTTDQSMSFSRKILKLVKDYDQTAVTGTDGISRFHNLTKGMYLVTEIGRDGEAEKYELMDPYIISVPLGMSTENGNYWEYNVLSKPKTKIVESSYIDTATDTSTDTTTDRTTDTTTDKSTDTATDKSTDTATDKSTDTTTDKSTDTATDTTTDTGTQSDSDKKSDTDKKNESTPSKTTSTNKYTTTTSGNNTTPNTIFTDSGGKPVIDIEKVKTGVITHVKEISIVMIISLVIMLLTIEKRKGEDDDESIL